MKHIRNARKYWHRLGALIELRADAIRRRKKRSHIEAEMRMIRTALTDYENRQSDKVNRNGIGSGRAAHGSAHHRKMACGSVAVRSSYRSRPSA